MANITPEQGSSRTGPAESRAAKQPAPQAENQAAGGLSGKLEKAAQGAEKQIKQAIDQGQEVRDRALSALEKKQSQLGERIRDVGGALRSGGRKLDEDNESVASLLNVASDQVERLASYVDTASPRSVASDLHQLARAHPAWVVGGSFLAGLALGRFLKSSAGGSTPSDGAPAFRADRELSSRYEPRHREPTYAAGQPSGRQYPAPRAPEGMQGGSATSGSQPGSQGSTAASGTAQAPQASRTTPASHEGETP